MNRTFYCGIAVLSMALITGCSSHRYSTGRVSYVEPGYATPTTYHHAETTYTDGFTTTDHGYTTRTVQTQFDTQPGTMTATPNYEARTVSMPISANRYEISLDELRGHVKNNTAVIVDAREPKHFSRGHVAGAINIPAGDEDTYMTMFRRDVEPGESIIVYCGGPDCPAGDNVATYLKSHGYTNVRVYKPGWQELSNTDLR